MNQHVLIVEDDLWLARLEYAALSEAGFATTTTTNALDAIESIDARRPDAIVLDVLLAGSTAFALLNELQSYDDTAVIPIILCTASADRLARHHLQKYGVVAVVDKTTMHPSDVCSAVRKALT